MRVIERNATVWKVISTKDRRLLSALHKEFPPSWVVEYRPGRWTYPIQKGSALFAFSSREKARRWGKRLWLAGDQVWRCKADIVNGELSTDSYILSCFHFLSQSFRAFWRDPQRYQETHHAVCSPGGGVWCKRIRLEKRA